MTDQLDTSKLFPLDVTGLEPIDDKSKPLDVSALEPLDVSGLEPVDAPPVQPVAVAQPQAEPVSSVFAPAAGSSSQSYPAPTGVAPTQPAVPKTIWNQNDGTFHQKLKPGEPIGIVFNGKKMMATYNPVTNKFVTEIEDKSKPIGKRVVEKPGIFDEMATPSLWNDGVIPPPANRIVTEDVFAKVELDPSQVQAYTEGQGALRSIRNTALRTLPATATSFAAFNAAGIPAAAWAGRVHPYLAPVGLVVGGGLAAMGAGAATELGVNAAFPLDETDELNQLLYPTQNAVTQHAVALAALRPSARTLYGMATGDAAALAAAGKGAAINTALAGQHRLVNEISSDKPFSLAHVFDPAEMKKDAAAGAFLMHKPTLMGKAFEYPGKVVGAKLSPKARPEDATQSTKDVRAANEPLDTSGLEPVAQGNVPPRPFPEGKTKFSELTAEEFKAITDWDTQYGNTHDNTGKPLNRDENTVAINVEIKDKPNAPAANIPPGHVEPMPVQRRIEGTEKERFDAMKAYEESRAMWTAKHGKTHNVDGSPKKPVAPEGTIPEGYAPPRPKWTQGMDPEASKKWIDADDAWESKYQKTHWDDGTPKGPAGQAASERNTAQREEIPTPPPMQSSTPEGTVPSRPILENGPGADLSPEAIAAHEKLTKEWDDKYSATHWTSGVPKADLPNPAESNINSSTQKDTAEPRVLTPEERSARTADHNRKLKEIKDRPIPISKEEAIQFAEEDYDAWVGGKAQKLREQAKKENTPDPKKALELINQAELIEAGKARLRNLQEAANEDPELMGPIADAAFDHITKLQQQAREQGERPPAPTGTPRSVEMLDAEAAASGSKNISVLNVDEIVAKGGGNARVSVGGKEVKFDKFAVVIDGEEATVAYVEIADKSQTQKGIGKGAYISLGNELAKRGITLRSSGALLNEGNKLWLSLVRDGYAKRQGSDYLFTPKEAQESPPEVQLAHLREQRDRLAATQPEPGTTQEAQLKKLEEAVAKLEGQVSTGGAKPANEEQQTFDFKSRANKAKGTKLVHVVKTSKGDVTVSMNMDVPEDAYYDIYKKNGGLIGFDMEGSSDWLKKGPDGKSGPYKSLRGVAYEGEMTVERAKKLAEEIVAENAGEVQPGRTADPISKDTKPTKDEPAQNIAYREQKKKVTELERQLARFDKQKPNKYTETQRAKIKATLDKEIDILIAMPDPIKIEKPNKGGPIFGDNLDTERIDHVSGDKFLVYDKQGKSHGTNLEYIRQKLPALYDKALEARGKNKDDREVDDEVDGEGDENYFDKRAKSTPTFNASSHNLVERILRFSRTEGVSDDVKNKLNTLFKSLINENPTLLSHSAYLDAAKELGIKIPKEPKGKSFLAVESIENGVINYKYTPFPDAPKRVDDAEYRRQEKEFKRIQDEDLGTDEDGETGQGAKPNPKVTPPDAGQGKDAKDAPFDYDKVLKTFNIVSDIGEYKPMGGTKAKAAGRIENVIKQLEKIFPDIREASLSEDNLKRMPMPYDTTTREEALAEPDIRAKTISRYLSRKMEPYRDKANAKDQPVKDNESDFSREQRKNIRTDYTESEREEHSKKAIKSQEKALEQAIKDDKNHRGRKDAPEAGRVRRGLEGVKKGFNLWKSDPKVRELIRKVVELEKLIKKTENYSRDRKSEGKEVKDLEIEIYHLSKGLLEKYSYDDIWGAQVAAEPTSITWADSAVVQAANEKSGYKLGGTTVKKADYEKWLVGRKDVVEQPESPKTEPAQEAAQEPAEKKYPIEKLEDALAEKGLKILRRNNTDDFVAEGGVEDNGRQRPTLVVGDTKITLASEGMELVNGKVQIMDGQEKDAAGEVIYNIERIVTAPEGRGKGSASKALDELTEAADKAGLTLQLEPTPFRSLIGKGESLNKGSLIEWYKKYGFEQKTEGSDAILIRKPGAKPERPKGWQGISDEQLRERIDGLEASAKEREESEPHGARNDRKLAQQFRDELASRQGESGESKSIVDTQYEGEVLAAKDALWKMKESDRKAESPEAKALEAELKERGVLRADGAVNGYKGVNVLDEYSYRKGDTIWRVESIGKGSNPDITLRDVNAGPKERFRVVKAAELKDAERVLAPWEDVMMQENEAGFGAGTTGKKIPKAIKHLEEIIRFNEQTLKLDPSKYETAAAKERIKAAKERIAEYKDDLSGEGKTLDMRRDWNNDANDAFDMEERKARELDRRVKQNAENREAGKEEDGGRRGFIGIMDRAVSEARLRGEITDKEVEGLSRIINYIGGQFFDGVKMSIRQGRPGHQGQYDVANRIVTIFKEAIQRGRFEDTAGHEVGHHLEQFLPEGDRAALRAEWLAARKKFTDKWSVFGRLVEGSDNWAKVKISKEAYAEAAADFPTLDRFLSPARNKKGEITHYEVRPTDEMYRLFTPREWFAETFKEAAREKLNNDPAYTGEQPGWKQKIAGVWNSIKTAFAQVFGKEQAKRILANFAKGRYKPEDADPSVYSEPKMSSKKDVEEATRLTPEERDAIDKQREDDRTLARGEKPELSAGGKVWRSVVDHPVVEWFKPLSMRMRTIADLNPQSEALQKVVNDFSLIPGKESEAPDYNTDSANMRNVFFNKLTKAFGPVLEDMRKMGPAELKEFNSLFIKCVEGRAPRQVGGRVGEAIKEVGVVLAEMHKYGIDAGLKLGKVEGFFPRSVDANAVDADKAGFVRAATKAYEVQFERLKQEAKDEAAKNGTEYVEAETPDFDLMARKWRDAILLGREGLDFEHGIFEEPRQGTKESFQKKREFTKDEALLFDAYRDKDVERTVINYVGGLVRKAEVSRRIGVDNGAWGKIKSEMDKQGVDPKDIAEIEQLIKSNIGIGGKRLGEQTQQALDFTKLISNAAYLKLTGLLNITEAASIGVRTESASDSVKAVWQMFRRTGNIVGRLTPEQTTNARNEIERIYGKGHDLASALAIEFGINTIDRGFGTIASGYHLDGGSDYQGKLNKASDGVYRMYGIHATEAAKREISLRIGADFIDTNIKWLEGTHNLQRIARAMGKEAKADNLAKDRLKELGIKESEMDEFSTWVKAMRKGNETQQLQAIMSGDPMAAKYRQALIIFNKQSSVQASRASRTESANDTSLGRMFFQFSTFTNEWSAQHGRRMQEQSRKIIGDNKYNATERMLMAGVGPAFAVATAATYGIRTIINMLTGFEFKDGDKVPAWVKSAADAFVYTGMLGPAEILWKAISRGQLPAGVVGDWLKKSWTTVAAMIENPDSNAAQRAAASVGYRSAFVPGANAGLALATEMAPMPYKIGAGIAAQVIANNRTEKAVADLFAGEKQERGSSQTPEPTVPPKPRPPSR